MESNADAEISSDSAADGCLLRRIGKGDKPAFGMVYEKYVRAVAWTARSMLGSIDLAEDVTQTTFLVLWQESKRITLVGESLLPWLLGTCRMQCRNLRVKERRRTHQQLDNDADISAAGFSTEDLVIQQATVMGLESHIESLKDIDRQIYRLCLRQELSYEAAANSLGISHAAVRNRLSRLKKNLRQFLSAQESKETS
ncbi:sigma-70 family RNA polymerase sigma factor [Paenarthrobacter sp. Z7-10]|uniref:RNA polymerase sigma factor n=1 Tax=Paenarthrobacter sp. Z7-10 TaxID=2787635 RepID=UPI0022A98F45|nr:sigma-70 family RNA polymerase sigma factor [Paenarthrobacter sp. Z7-10]MCZ2402701.1 sigma-70 family RNA polymerase sigma factor [Paenarthrobacter sp. Z7-10]